MFQTAPGLPRVWKETPVMDQRCRRCHVTYPEELVEAAFQPSGVFRRMHPSKKYRSRICYPCVRTAQDLRKRANRWTAKARDTIKLHSDKLKIPTPELAEKYGWTIERIARDMASRYAEGLGLCDECQEPYGPMGHGPADLTLDISRPGEEPYYSTNTRYICMTENREKHNLSPERWQLRKRVWAWWKSHKDLPPDDLGLLF